MKRTFLISEHFHAFIDIQDQTIAIVTEVCETDKSKQIQPNTQAVCLLLLKIVEMALYLEHCVSQICGIRPVMGRVEDFSKQMRFLVRGKSLNNSFPRE